MMGLNPYFNGIYFLTSMFEIMEKSLVSLNPYFRDSRKILWKFTTYWLLMWYNCCNLAKGNKNSSEYRRKVNFGGNEQK